MAPATSARKPAFSLTQPRIASVACRSHLRLLQSWLRTLRAFSQDDAHKINRMLCDHVSPSSWKRFQAGSVTGSDWWAKRPTEVLRRATTAGVVVC
jgi:hypothetical protein